MALIREEKPDAAAAAEGLDLLRAQDAHCAALESLIARQRALLTPERLGELLSVLARRAEITGELSRLMERLSPVRPGGPAHCGRWTPDQRHQARGYVNAIRSRLQRMMHGDEQDVRILAGRKQALAETLQATRRSGATVRAYASVPAQSRRLDCLDEAAL